MGEIGFGSTSHAQEGLDFGPLRVLERGLHLRSTSHALDCEEREQFVKVFNFDEGVFSSSVVQQGQLACAGCNSFLDYHTWGTARSTRRSLLLCVPVHPELHYAHQQLLQYTSLLPRAHRIET